MVGHFRPFLTDSLLITPSQPSFPPHGRAFSGLFAKPLQKKPWGFVTFGLFCFIMKSKNSQPNPAMKIFAVGSLPLRGLRSLCSLRPFSPFPAWSETTCLRRAPSPIPVRGWTGLSEATAVSYKASEELPSLKSMPCLMQRALRSGGKSSSRDEAALCVEYG